MYAALTNQAEEPATAQVNGQFEQVKQQEKRQADAKKGWQTVSDGSYQKSPGSAGNTLRREDPPKIVNNDVTMKRN